MGKLHLQPPAKSSRLVVIDDQRTHLEYLTTLLKREHYECHGFTNARKALTFIHHHKVDLVLADVFMPEMDGFEFLRAVRQLFPTMPVFMMSGSGTRASSDFFLDCALRLGAVAALRKPLDVAALIAAIERAVTHECNPLQEQSVREADG